VRRYLPREGSNLGGGSSVAVSEPPHDMPHGRIDAQPHPQRAIRLLIRDVLRFAARARAHGMPLPMSSIVLPPGLSTSRMVLLELLTSSRVPMQRRRAVRCETSRSSGRRRIIAASGAVLMLAAVAIALSACAANPQREGLATDTRTCTDAGDRVVVRTAAGKCTIEVNGEQIGTYDAPEAEGHREVVINSRSDGTTTIAVDGVPVVNVKE
jgi:hypothetical protein